MNYVDLDRVCMGRTSRLDLWSSFLNEVAATSVAEIGVWRGEFAAGILNRCPGIDTYYMIDPWRHLDDWNKPANVSDANFDEIMAEALDKTGFAANRVRVLRGRTIDVVDEIADGSLDFAYIDGDHSLRGITIDLQLIRPKVRTHGWIGGDDFAPTVWQHPRQFEPTFVFPYAVYFAEACKAQISALQYNQFLIQLGHQPREVFCDRTGAYPSLTVASALRHAHRRRPHRMGKGLIHRLFAGRPNI